MCDVWIWNEYRAQKEYAERFMKCKWFCVNRNLVITAFDKQKNFREDWKVFSKKKYVSVQSVRENKAKVRNHFLWLFNTNKMHRQCSGRRANGEYYGQKKKSRDSESSEGDIPFTGRHRVFFAVCEKLLESETSSLAARNMKKRNMTLK